jgi:hypothetical protein
MRSPLAVARKKRLPIIAPVTLPRQIRLGRLLPGKEQLLEVLARSILVASLPRTRRYLYMTDITLTRTAGTRSLLSAQSRSGILVTDASRTAIWTANQKRARILSKSSSPLSVTTHPTHGIVRTSDPGVVKGMATAARMNGAASNDFLAV